MVWGNWADGARMTEVRTKINELGSLFETAITRPLEHSQADLNAGVLDDSRLISPAQMREAIGYQDFNPQAMPVAVGSFARRVGTLEINQQFGVSSISVGSSYFTVNLARPMASNKYAIIISAVSLNSGRDNNDNTGNRFADLVTTTSFRIYFLQRQGNFMITNIDNISFMVFGDLA